MATLPTVVNVGTFTAGTTSALAVGIPASIANNDLLLMFVETANQAVTSINIPGWTEFTSSPQGTGTAGGASATRLTAYWKFTNGSEVAPTVSVTGGDHVLAVIIAFRNVDLNIPINATAGAVQVTAVTNLNNVIPSVNTSRPTCLIVTAVANAVDSATARFSGWTNGAGQVTSYAEISGADGGTTTGNGGGIGVAAGTKATAGATGTFSATQSSSVAGMITIALNGYPSLALTPMSGIQQNVVP